MSTQARLDEEQSIMQRYFPTFSFFVTRSGSIGFLGHLRGTQSGRVYQVIIKAKTDSYPEVEPAVYMYPHAEGHHWLAFDEEERRNGGKLCYMRSEGVWTPRNTFANCLLMAIKYLKEFD